MLTPLNTPYPLLVQALLYGGALLMAMLAGACLVRAWQGRTIAWSPTCRRCGFDLRARAADLPEHCPECGRSLRGQVVAGPRRRFVRDAVLAAALGILAAGVVAGTLAGLPQRLNEWLLSQRSIDSLRPSLAADDQRAWRLAITRAQRGLLTQQESETLFELCLARIRRGGAATPSDEWVLTTLQSGSTPPKDSVRRLLELFFSMPTSMRISTPTEGVAVGDVLPISATAPIFPSWIARVIQLRIERVEIVESGAALEPFAVPRVDPAADEWRFMANSRLFRAPGVAGEIPVRIRVGLRGFTAAPEGAGGEGASVGDATPTCTGALWLPATILVRPAGSAPAAPTKPGRP